MAARATWLATGKVAALGVISGTRGGMVCFPLCSSPQVGSWAGLPGGNQAVVSWVLLARPRSFVLLGLCGVSAKDLENSFAPVQLAGMSASGARRVPAGFTHLGRVCGRPGHFRDGQWFGGARSRAGRRFSWGVWL